MREATVEDIGHDVMSSLENRKHIARKPLKKAIVSCFMLGLSDGEVQTVMYRTYAQCVAERAERRRLKTIQDEAAE